MSTNTTERSQSGISIPLNEIAVEDGHNPRASFDEAQLAELVASIRIHGVVQAITVRPNPEGTGYLVVAGHRRLEAAQRAALEQIPALVRDGDGALAAAIAENLIREDLESARGGRGDEPAESGRGPEPQGARGAGRQVSQLCR